MSSGELLQTSHSPEPRHRPLSSAKRKVCVFGAVIQVSACCWTIAIADLLHGSATGSQPVSDDDFRAPIPLHCFSQEFQSSDLVTLLCNVGFKHLALMVHSAPAVACFTADFHKGFVQMPPPLPYLTHGFMSSLADFPGEVSTEPVDSEVQTFMANVDPAFMEKVFDVPQRQREADIHQDSELDDFWRRLEVAGGRFGHFPRLLPGSEATPRIWPPQPRLR